MDPARRRATYDDLLALPDGTRAEVVAGEVVVAPAPLPRHARAQGALRRFVGGPYDDDDGYGGPGGWWILPEVDVRLGSHDIVRPDLSGWRRERLPAPANLRPIEVVPDWIAEVISDSNASHDRVVKRRLYAAAGVPHYWLVDPKERTLEALALRDGLWVELGVFGDDAVVAIPPFEAVELALARLFFPRDGE